MLGQAISFSSFSNPGFVAKPISSTGFMLTIWLMTLSIEKQELAQSMASEGLVYCDQDAACSCCLQQLRTCQKACTGTHAVNVHQGWPQALACFADKRF